MPKEHPLWILVAVLYGLANRQGGGTNESKTQAALSGEAIRRLETSIKQILTQNNKTKPDIPWLPLILCAAITVATLILAVVMACTPNSPKIPDGYEAILQEMRTCSGQHVMRLNDGSCAMKVSVHEDTDTLQISVFTWKPEEK